MRDLIERLRNFEGSDELGNGDFSLLREAADALEALRAEVAEWKRVAAAQAELHDEAEARAERLAEALRRYRNEVPIGHQPHMLAHEVDDLLREQEEGK